MEAEAMAILAAEHDLGALPREALAAHERVQAEVSAAIERANKRLARVEQIKRFVIVAGDWESGSDELTPTMKALFAQLWANDDDVQYRVAQSVLKGRYEFFEQDLADPAEASVAAGAEAGAPV